MLEEAAERVPAEARAAAVLRDGRPATIIADEAEKGIHLLVMGSRNYGPIRRVMAGSTAIELMRLAPCPLLVLPRGASAPSSGSRRGRRGNGYVRRVPSRADESDVVLRDGSTAHLRDALPTDRASQLSWRDSARHASCASGARPRSPPLGRRSIGALGGERRPSATRLGSSLMPASSQSTMASPRSPSRSRRACADGDWPRS